MTDKTDIVERLLELAPYVEQQPPVEYEVAASNAMRDAAAEIARLRAEVERLRNEKRQFLGIAIEMGDILAAAAKARGVNFPHLDEAMASLSRAALAEEQTP